ncbi:MAG: AAA domain-containing protein [Gammaproteobacteria bacterium]
MTLEEQIQHELSSTPGQTARKVAVKLGVDKREVNSLLYGRLSGKFKQDSKYCWWPQGSAAQSQSESIQKPEATFADTPLADLARYYLACLGQDDVGEVSVWARSNHKDFDYVELNELPQDNIQGALQNPQAANLLNKMHRDRTPKIFYLGYPISIHRFTSKAGNVIHRLQPVFVVPIEFEGPNNRGAASLASDFPIMNMAVLKRFSNSDQATVMNELLQLEDELGYSDSMEPPDLDDVARRLFEVRSEWPWREECVPEELSEELPISELEDPGIYNRAVLLAAERKPYTQGLETELRNLAKLAESDYANTALGALVNSNIKSDAGKAIKEPLLEVLPANTEQRQAIGSSLTQPLTIITGPPGTGKSQVVTNLLINAAWQGKKVLFASKNNKAVDVVETRVNSLGPRPLLLRMGSNEYQVRLKDYLQALLSATAGQDEKREYEERLQIHKKLAEKSAKLQSRQNKVINLRNKVDALEQRVEPLREKLSAKLFSAVRSLDLARLSEDLDGLHNATINASKAHQGLLTQLTWPLLRKSRFERLSISCEERGTPLLAIRVKAPDKVPSDLSIAIWLKFSEFIKNRVEDLKSVREYFDALEALEKEDSLETLNQSIRDVMEEISVNSGKLWSSWLRVRPSQLSSDDRQLLSKYVSVLQIITDNNQGQTNRGVWRQYYELTEKVSHLLPCWAVTSLSARGKVPFTAAYYDLVVFDEASQCDIASALPLLYRAKNAVVIGDPMQLSHISGIHKHQDQQLLERFDLQENFLQWAYSWNSLFDMARSYARGEDIVNLRDHHRSHADIINFSNNFFYEGRLRVATRYDWLRRPQTDSPGVRWIDLPGRTIRPPNGSAENPPEAQAIVDELRHLVLEQGYKGSIGVVSPFRAQANQIKNLCNQDRELQNRLDELEFLSDTVHRFQGDERDVMVFSPVVSNGAAIQSLGFLKRNGNLFNVAITRARAMLLVVGDKSAAKNSGVEYLAEFAKYVDNLDDSEVVREHVQRSDLGPEYPTTVDLSKVSEWEIDLYKALYQAGIRPIPQYPVEQYLLDLALIEGNRRLDIEVDGERYHRNWDGELCRRDQIRNQRMYELGWDVQRFWVYEIRDDLDKCIARIQAWVEGAEDE